MSFASSHILILDVADVTLKVIKNAHDLCVVQEYRQLRMDHVQTLKDKGESPYPHKFHVSISLEAFIEKYQCLDDGEHHTDVVSVAG